MTERSIEELIAELTELRIRVGQVETELSAQRTLGTERVTPINLSKGDRVRITNQIRRPAVWPSTVAWDDTTKEKERNATITHFRPGQVHIITENGTRTWRAANNLRKR